MAEARSDRAARNSLWLIAHERDDPMMLSQSEFASEDAADALKRVIEERLSEGAQVDPPIDKCEVGRRYDVHDADGWLGTYWLSEEQVSAVEGMLTAIVSPGAKQRAHHLRHRSR